MSIHTEAILSRFVLHVVPQYEDAPVSATTTSQRAGTSACSAYEVVPRITCVDQAVIHAYTGERGAAATGMPDDRVCQLPAELERSLSKLPAALKRLMVGCDLLLIDMRTGRVVDRMRGVRPARQLS